MKSVRFISVAVSFGLGLAIFGGCATGHGGVIDGVLGTVDSGAATRTRLREAAQNKHAFLVPLIAAHNQGQQALTRPQQREIVEWWLGENGGVHVKTIEGTSMSSVYSGYKDLAKNRPEAGSEQYTLWVETMQGYETLFRAQADVLEAIASHWEANGTTASVSAEDLSNAIAMFRERASVIRGKAVNYREGAITANLNPGESITVTANQGAKAPITRRDVDNTAGALNAAQRGNAAGAANAAGRVIFGK